MEALKKSAEQAKEILSLRDRLTAAEERFKSFDFEGRIISIKQQYQQKVSSLENQLQEISDTCMKQVEEIESLKAENLKLHKAAAEKDEALARLEAKERELTALKAEMAALQTSHSEDSKNSWLRLRNNCKPWKLSVTVYKPNLPARRNRLMRSARKKKPWKTISKNYWLKLTKMTR